MNISKRILLGLTAMCCCSLSLLASCGVDEVTQVSPEPPTSETERRFVAGADVSWLTQLEKEGRKFYTSSGEEKECMRLLRDDCGVGAIRLRVWLDPADGWNGTDDVLLKSRRARDLGLDLMIDFHFRDTWADPGQQDVPVQWASLDIDGLREAVAMHVTDLLGRLKAEGIAPKWVQIGNETPDGMLFPLGKASEHPENFASLVTAGYDAVKSVFPDAAVIVHVDNGHNQERFMWLFDILKANDARYDMIGMSLYPWPAGDWMRYASACLDNARALTARYGKSVMICEVGMPYDEPDMAYDLLTYLCDNGRDKGIVEGVFYWEPEAPAGYNGGYDKGCFDNGRPTRALDAFKNISKKSDKKQ